MAFPYKLVIFDIDNTLTESRSPIGADLAKDLSSLIDQIPVALISGGSLSDFEAQVISRLSHVRKENLCVLPTEGAQLRIYKNGGFETVYSYSIDDHKRRKIFEELAKLAHTTPVRLGDLIEDRGGVIAYHPLGKNAPLSEKYAWDPTREKRAAMIEKLSPKLHGVFMAAAGSTTINFSEEGVNKAFGVTKILEYLKITPKEALFIGDALEKGGNDEPVKAVGVKTIDTSGPKETLKIIGSLLKGEAGLQ
jgi:phosphomannomutase